MGCGWSVWRGRGKERERDGKDLQREMHWLVGSQDGAAMEKARGIELMQWGR